MIAIAFILASLVIGGVVGFFRDPFDRLQGLVLGALLGSITSLYFMMLLFGLTALILG